MVERHGYQSHVVRAWANAHGHNLGRTGRIPQSVYDAYDEAKGQSAKPVRQADGSYVMVATDNQTGETTRTPIPTEAAEAWLRYQGNSEDD